MVPLFNLLRRRWITALAGLLLAAAVCVVVSTHVQPKYQASGQMLFLLPPENPDPEEPPLNPYLNTSEGMGTTANLIAGLVTTKDVQNELADRGLTAGYTVTYVPTSGPLLELIATGASPVVALATRDAVMELVDNELLSLQEEANTPANQLMTASRPTVSKQAETLHGGVYKAVAGAAGAGLLFVLLLCLALDRFAVLRTARARRSKAATTASDLTAVKRRTRFARQPAPAAAVDKEDPGGGEQEKVEVTPPQVPMSSGSKSESQEAPEEDPERAQGSAEPVDSEDSAESADSDEPEGSGHGSGGGADERSPETAATELATARSPQSSRRTRNRTARRGEPRPTTLGRGPAEQSRSLAG